MYNPFKGMPKCDQYFGWALVLFIFGLLSILISVSIHILAGMK